nr:hypothetical protein [Lachnospiraceae bacterium]
MAKVKAWTKEHCLLLMAAGIWLAVEFMIQATTGDEPAYQSALQLQSLSEYITYYFETWSNRILIDVLAVVVLAQPMIVFKVFNVLVFFMHLLGFKKLLLKDRTDKMQELFLLTLFFMIPYSCFLDAGFSVTCMYYLWPATAGIWSIYIVLKKQSSLFLKLVGALLLVFACNMEQTALLMNVVLLLVCCVNLSNREKKSYPWLMFVTAIGCILFMLLGEGGNHRVKVEIGHKFPEYIGLTALQKFDMGFSTTMEHLIMGCDPLWILFVTFLFLVLIREKKFEGYILGAIPFGCSLAFGLFKESLLPVFPPLSYMYEAVGEYGVIDLNNYDLRNRWVVLLLFLFVLATVIAGLYLTEENVKRVFLLIFAFGGGFLSRLIMGFSPTIYASGDRTYYPFWLVLIVLVYGLFQKLDKDKQERVNIITMLIALVSVCSTVVSLNR